MEIVQFKTFLQQFIHFLFGNIPETNLNWKIFHRIFRLKSPRRQCLLVTSVQQFIVDFTAEAAGNEETHTQQISKRIQRYIAGKLRTNQFRINDEAVKSARTRHQDTIYTYWIFIFSTTRFCIRWIFFENESAIGGFSGTVGMFNGRFRGARWVSILFSS